MVPFRVADLLSLTPIKERLMPLSQEGETRRLPVADLCLVSGVKTKLSRRAPAKELYASARFRKTCAVVEAEG